MADANAKTTKRKRGSWGLLAIAGICAVGFMIDYLILGHGTGVAGKVYSFMGGYAVGSCVTAALCRRPASRGFHW